MEFNSISAEKIRTKKDLINFIYEWWFELLLFNEHQKIYRKISLSGIDWIYRTFKTRDFSLYCSLWCLGICDCTAKRVAIPSYHERYWWTHFRIFIWGNQLAYGRFNIDVRIFSEAVAIDTKNKTVTVRNLKSGEEYVERYDSLVLSEYKAHHYT